MEKDYLYIWISQMMNLRYESLEILIEKYGSLYSLWKLSKDELVKNMFLNYKEICDFLNLNYRNNLKILKEQMKIRSIKIIGFDDVQYPIKLKVIKNRPKVLYVIGDISKINNESIAIVGSRKASNYGMKNADFFASNLAKRKVNIVSGLAKGIDSCSHKAAIMVKGITYAVLANGLDYIYPRENLNLAIEIIKSGGAIISEFVIGTKLLPDNFIHRNRIISGLSNATIVVEAGKKSGALVTAGYAIEQGREVWAIPGNINLENSKGTNELIRDGANVLTCLDDIIVEKCKMMSNENC